MDDGWVGPVAGLDGVGSAFVVALFTPKGADEGDVFHLIRELIQPRRELHALHGGVDGCTAGGDVRAGFRIECFQLTRSAAHPQHNHRLRRPLHFLGFAGQDRPQRRQPCKGCRPCREKGPAVELRKLRGHENSVVGVLNTSRWMHSEWNYPDPDAEVSASPAIDDIYSLSGSFLGFLLLAFFTVVVLSSSAEVGGGIMSSAWRSDGS